MLAIEDIVDRVRLERGWSRQSAAKHARSYALFLSDRNGGAVPSAEVDAIWHEHILHTRRYREDCLSLVGHFVDHEPNAGRECSQEGPAEPPDIAGAECVRPVVPPDIVGAHCTRPVGPPPPPPDIVLESCSKPAPVPPPGRSSQL
jgi:hypothetical protein